MSEQPEEQLPTRWEVELEFVQSLANIQYVHFLAQNDFLSDERFLAYLDYLNYWREPRYAKYLVYPNCLHILTLLQSPDFRKQIVNPALMNTLMNDMVKKWQGSDDLEGGTSQQQKDLYDVISGDKSEKEKEKTKSPANDAPHDAPMDQNNGSNDPPNDPNGSNGSNGTNEPNEPNERNERNEPNESSNEHKSPLGEASRADSASPQSHVSPENSLGQS